jgi:ADP-ribosylglycohydrolase
MGDPQEIYQEKVQAVLFGAALGDAVGLLTELKSETDINEMYPKKTDLVFPSPEPLRGYTLGDWTDETDQLIVVLDTLKDCSSNGRLNNYSKQIFNDPSVKELRLKTDSSNRVHKPVSQLSPEQLFAYKLKYWVTEGFPAIGDDVGKGCESLVHQISTRAGFIKNPIGIAQNIWQRRGKPVTNSCVPRSAAIGLLDDLSTVFKLTERFCLVTHSDPRNVASCVIVSFLIFTFTHHDVPREKIEDVIGLAIQHGKQVLRHKKHRSQLDHYCYSTLADLQLRKEAVTDFTFRALGCGIWALRYVARTKNRKNLFTRAIRNIVMEGGDADCNAATAGALLGACLGFKKLPKKWLKALPHRDWLDQLIEKFVKVRFDEEVDEETEEYSIEESSEYSESYSSSSESSSDSDY